VRRGCCRSWPATACSTLESDLDSSALIAIAFSRPQNALVFGACTAMAIAAGTVLL